MKTDTPQTDSIDIYQPFIVSEPKYNALAELCRTLERELTEALQQRNLTISELASFQAELTAEQEKARKLALDLAAEERGQENLRRMIEAEQEKVKRLREALQSISDEVGYTATANDWPKLHNVGIIARATLEATK